MRNSRYLLKEIERLKLFWQVEVEVGLEGMREVVGVGAGKIKRNGRGEGGRGLGGVCESIRHLDLDLV
jgi:hypothetical protein